MEYLNFEYWYADRLHAGLRRLEVSFYNAWDDGITKIIRQPFTNGLSLRNLERPRVRNKDLETDWVPQREEFKTVTKTIVRFLEQTRPYRNREKVVHRQNVLVQMGIGASEQN